MRAHAAQRLNTPPSGRTDSRYLRSAALALLLLASSGQLVSAASDAQPVVAVGATPATFEVNQQGGATYRIPLAVAPGAGGLQPTLALVYNSHGGDGPLGVGWTLEGLSTIHRCAAIKPLHGYRGRVTLGDEDRLCIDGRFLTPVDGASSSLQGREFRTQIESFTQITAPGIAGSEIADGGFTARTQDGQIITYGTTADARIQRGATVFSWLMNRVADRAGNAMFIRYAVLGNERHIRRIDYANASVSFEYEAYPDAHVMYLAGMDFPLTQKLVRVSAQVGGRLVREYHLRYDAGVALRAAHLRSVTECSEDGCLRPTVFTLRSRAAFALSPWSRITQRDDSSNDDRRYHTGDFNGDGLADIYEIRGDGSSDYDAIQLNLGDGTFESVLGPQTTVQRRDDLVNFHFADFNGDGLTDVYQFRYRQARDQLYLASIAQGALSFEETDGIDSGVRSSPSVAGGCVHRDCLRFADFNGDARTDIYRIRHQGKTPLSDEIWLSQGDGHYTQAAGILSAADSGESAAAIQVGRIKVGDFNGDGIADLYRIAATSGADDIYLTLHAGEYQRIDGIASRLNLRSSGHAQLLRVKFGDFNGDGLTDVYYATPGRFTPDTVYLSHGDGRYTVSNTQAFIEAGSGSSLQTSLQRIRLGDFNGDGRSDIYYLPENGTHDSLYLTARNGQATGEVVRFARPSQTRRDDLGRVHFNDFNGDGALDVYHVQDVRAGEGEVYVGRRDKGELAMITDGLGAGMRIHYAQLAAVHELATHSEYDAVRVPPPIRVVSALEILDGSAQVLRSEHYRYGGARSALSGFGFLGFAWQETHDPGRQLTTRTVYSHTFPYFGRVLERTITTAAGQTVYRAHTEYDTLTLSDTQTLFPHVVRSQAQRHGLDGAFVLSQSDTFSYDEYGNTLVTKTVTEDQSRHFMRTVRHEYHNDALRWILGRRVRTQTVYGDDLHADITQDSRAEYDAETGFLLAQTAQPDAAGALTRRYTYDVFGNRVSERVEPASDPALAVATHWSYEPTGRFAVRVINPEGHTTESVYDERFGKALSRTGPNGLQLRREYDGWGRLIREVRPDATQTRFERRYTLPEEAPAGSAYLVMEEKSGRAPRRVFYDVFNRVLRVHTVGFDGRALFEDREYDRYGRVIRISLPYYQGEQADWVERRYDSLDRLVEESSPLIDGAVTTRWFNYQGAAVEHIDELGHSRWVYRDALGRVVLVSEPHAARRAFEYDPAGRLIRATDAHGNETVMEYDVFGNRRRVNYPDQGVQRFAYDPFGRVTETVDAAGNTRRMRYDALGRLIERSGPEGTARWSYDATANGVGKVASESYDGHHRSFRYNEVGQLVAIEDHRGYVMAMRYEQGRVREMHYPRGFIVENVYDERGYLTAVRSPHFESGDLSVTAPEPVDTVDLYRGKADEYQQLASFYRRWAGQVDDDPVAEALDTTATELEDGAQQLLGLVPDSSESSAYCESRVSTQIVRAEGALRDAAEAGLRLRFKTSIGAHTESQMYARMALAERMLDKVHGCLTTVSPSAAAEDAQMPPPIVYWQAQARDTVGRVVSERNGNGWHTRRRYHTGNGYLQEIRSDAGEHRDVRHLVYDYDEADNLLSRTDHTQQISEYFGYDELGRLTTSAVLSDIEHDDYNKISWYRYDALGNLSFYSEAGDYLYGSDAPHAATQIGKHHYAYDASGNLTHGAGLSAEWFSFGKPAALETADARLEFSYDANGRRLSKRLSEGDVTLYLDKYYEKTLKADGAVEHRYYIYAGDRLLAMRYDREHGEQLSRRLRYLHRDALGSVDTISDESGEIVTRLSYTPFGLRRASDWRATSTPSLPRLVNRGFTGHEHLDEVGLIHMNGRIYNPQVGRFLSPDPYVPSALLTQSYNRYSYAINNPMKFSDPSGFIFKKVFKGIKRVIKKAVGFVRRNARLLVAVAAGYYAGAWASNAFVQSTASKLVWSPGGMWSGAYISAYNSALANGALVGGLVSGGVSSALAGGNLRGVIANATGAAVLGGLGANLSAAGVGQWTPQRVLASAAVNGTTAAFAGGTFRDAALSSLKWGGLRYASAQMRRAMIAQSLLNPDNAGGLSAGLFGDRFKLGGGRYDVHSDAPSLLGGHQSGKGVAFGIPYAPDSLWDHVIEAYAGAHDYFNSFYWYDKFGNIKNHLSPMQRHFGQALNGANVLVATPFATASLAPEHLPIVQP